MPDEVRWVRHLEAEVKVLMTVSRWEMRVCG